MSKPLFDGIEFIIDGSFFGGIAVSRDSA